MQIVRWQHPHVIGLDAGAETLRAVQLRRQRTGPVLANWTEQRRPRYTTDDAPPTGDASETFADASEGRPTPTKCPSLAALDGFAGREVAMCVGPPTAEYCALRVPDSLLAADHKSLLRAIRHEVSQHIKRPTDHIEIDAWPLAPGHRDACNIMATASPRDQINQTLKWLDSQNVSCVRLDAAPLVLLRAAAAEWHEGVAGRMWGVLDVGARASRLYLGIGQTPVYVRCLQNGGDAMTARIAAELQVDWRTAERYKRHFGLATDGHAVRPMHTLAHAADEERMASILSGVLQPILQGIATEIERSYRYMMALYPDTPVAGLILAGAGTCLAGFGIALERMLGIPVRPFAARAIVARDRGHHNLPPHAAPGIAAALGLCLGEVS
jgi:Tfp pilus assembly PilM family ATPase